MLADHRHLLQGLRLGGVITPLLLRLHGLYSGKLTFEIFALPGFC